MAWTYNSSTGVMLRPDGSKLTTGYSGSPAGKNNPNLESVHNVGPIPRGQWTIGPAYTVDYEGKKPPVMHLIPVKVPNLNGRSGFLIHGDSISAPGTASLGCVIIDHNSRLEIADSLDQDLDVV